MKRWNNPNPPGLPAWPLLDVTHPKIILVSGKLKDTDTKKKLALFISWLLTSAIIFILLASVAILDEFRFSDPMVAGFLVWWVTMLALFGSFLFPSLVGFPIAWLVLTLFPKKIKLKFTPAGVELIQPHQIRRIFDLSAVPKIEFHATPGPPAKWVEGIVVNLVFGSELVRLFRISEEHEQVANDFVASCRWAASKAWSGEQSHPGSRHSAGEFPNDRD